MIPPAVMRSVWLTVGIAAALLCGLGLTVFVGMALVELVAPSSTESSGPSPVLVLTPWLVGTFLLARWSLRRSDQLLTPTAPGTGTLWRFEDWMAEHPVWRGVVIVALELSWLSLVIGVVWALLVGAALAVVHLITAFRRHSAPVGA